MVEHIGRIHPGSSLGEGIVKGARASWGLRSLRCLSASWLHFFSGQAAGVMSAAWSSCVGRVAADSSRVCGGQRQWWFVGLRARFLPFPGSWWHWDCGACMVGLNFGGWLCADAQLGGVGPSSNIGLHLVPTVILLRPSPGGHFRSGVVQPSFSSQVSHFVVIWGWPFCGPTHV